MPTDESSVSGCPSISLIVLNYNGKQHLEECLGSLLKLDYPVHQYEIVLVDNASGDGSVEYVQEQFPSVRVIKNPTNLGFAAGNNVGARQVNSEYVVFLNNDMWVEPKFVQGLLEAIGSNSKIVCASAKILNWDATQIDFAGSAAHFAGYAYQIGHGKSADSKEFDKIRPILFACGGAMMVKRQVFLEAGGFDEDFFAIYEDFDLGWRLWLLGYSIMFAPRAVVHHRHHGTLKSFAEYKKAVLYKRNSLYTIVKNYDDENMASVLAAILLANGDQVVKEAERQNHLNLADFDFLNPPSTEPITVTLDKVNAATLVAIHDLVEHLPQLMLKRRSIQAKRSRTDQELAELFRWPFRFWPGVSEHTQYKIADAFKLQDIFETAPRRVLIFSSDILPYPGLPTVGSGLRAWGLGQGLKDSGHDVLFSMPRAALSGRIDVVPPEVADLAWEHHTMLSVVQKVEPDVVIVCNWAIMGLLPTEYLSIPVILDQHGPHMLEREYQHFGDFDGNARAKIEALRRSDFFTCAGYKQQSYFRKWLGKAGWTDKESEEQFAAIPVSLSPDLPERAPSTELTFVYGGVFLPWQDPSLSLTVLVEMMDSCNRGKLLFYGGRHPVYPVDPGMFESLSDQLKRSSHVVMGGMVSHDLLIANYCRAHVAIDLMKRNPERELAFTTRTVEYLWCGLPVIYNDYSELSDYIREYNAGWVVNPDDRQAIAQVIQEIFDHPEEVEKRSHNAQRLARERLCWATTTAPLDYFVRHPRKRVREHQPQPMLAPVSPSPRIIIRNARYLLNEARLHYRRGGISTLWREGWAFMSRQIEWAAKSRRLSNQKR